MNATEFMKEVNFYCVMKGCVGNCGKKFRLKKKNASGKNILSILKYTAVQKHIPKGILEAKKP